MALLPIRIQDVLDFCELHAAVWDDAPALIGLTPAQATAFTALTVAARAAFTAQLAAVESARVATEAAQNAVRDLRAGAGDTIRLIRAFAESSTKPATVYQLAQIPAPAAPSPVPPPAQPTDFRVELDPLGLITLRWKAKNPAGAAGTVYALRRKLAGESQYAFVGSAGARRFTDTTLPAGTAQAQYIVQGQRAGSVGPQSFPFTVNFGVAGPEGSMTITGAYSEEIGGAGSAKMAA